MTAEQRSCEQLIRENYELRARLAAAERALVGVGYEPVGQAGGPDIVGADLSERRQLEADVQDHQREIVTLHRISEIVLREQPLSAALNEVVQEISACTDFPIAAIEFYDEALQLMEFAAATGIPMFADNVGFSIPVDQTLSGLVARSGQPLIETHAQDRSEYIDAALRLLGVQTFICVPMRVMGRVIGTLALAHPEIIPLSVRIVPLAHSLANFIAALVTRKRTEADLQVALTKYRTLFAAFPLGITVSDDTGQIVETNATAEHLLGIGREEQSQRQIDGVEWRIVRPDGSPMPVDEYASVRALKEQRTVDNVEMGIVTSAGVTTWINVTAAPLPVEQYGVVITYGDITARKQAEQALRESRQNLESLIENTDGSIWSVDAQYRLIVGNRLYHHNVSAALGRSLAPGESVLAPELPQAALDEWQAYYDRAMQSGSFSVEASTRFTQEPRTVEYRLSPITTATGQVVGATVFGRDVTTRKQAEIALSQALDELKRSNADLEQFASVASHDLQEPLRAVTGMVQLLQQRYQGQIDARADQYIGLAVESASRMQALINDLLALSRVQRHGTPFVPTAAEAALVGALANLHVAITESAAVITYDALPTVQADPAQLTQLFQNLIGNAIKFRDELPPRIHISAERRDGAWCFAVRDNGIGIAPNHFEHIFVVFQRLHSRQAYPGTGIGLAISKKIVERHGGQIWVDSRLGYGATFFFTIPDPSSPFNTEQNG